MSALGRWRITSCAKGGLTPRKRRLRRGLRNIGHLARRDPFCYADKAMWPRARG
jgi:hypothetical protein